MTRSIGAISLLVSEYDDAISFYTHKLGFTLIEDTDLGGGKRWVMVSPSGAGATRLLLAKAVTPEQESRVGDQTGGRVFLFLHTDNFKRDYESMIKNSVRFLEQPRHESYGTVAVFEDLYGNKLDLLELKP
jgi:catechol 2,3-dioxygenase-like lactoylglutathione lyase family enzyme